MLPNRTETLHRRSKQAPHQPSKLLVGPGRQRKPSEKETSLSHYSLLPSLRYFLLSLLFRFVVSISIQDTKQLTVDRTIATGSLTAPASACDSPVSPGPHHQHVSGPPHPGSDSSTRTRSAAPPTVRTRQRRTNPDLTPSKERRRKLLCSDRYFSQTFSFNYSLSDGFPTPIADSDFSVCHIVNCLFVDFSSPSARLQRLAFTDLLPLRCRVLLPPLATLNH